MVGRPKYQKTHKTSRFKWVSAFSDTHWVLPILLRRRQCRIAQKKASWLESKMLSRSFPHPIIGKNPWWKKVAASQCGVILSQMQADIMRRNKFSGQWLSLGISRWTGHLYQSELVLQGPQLSSDKTVPLTHPRPVCRGPRKLLPIILISSWYSSRIHEIEIFRLS